PRLVSFRCSRFLHTRAQPPLPRVSSPLHRRCPISISVPVSPSSRPSQNPPPLARHATAKP
uniref:Uncharacterized protein n=1 Tax=Aegilops tauschii subsp. strangulata TaxID=200361 RepID=A0A453R5L1_AEGTS